MGFPAWPIREAPLALIYGLIRTMKPLTVVETGVAHGASTTAILRALGENGRGTLWSVDLANAVYETQNRDCHRGNLGQVVDSMQGREVGWLIDDDLRGRWRLVLGRSADKLSNLLDELGSIDVFLHDSEHTYENMMYEYQVSWPHIRPGGFLLSDDVDWNSAFADFASSKNAKSRVSTSFGCIRKPTSS